MPNGLFTYPIDIDAQLMEQIEEEKWTGDEHRYQQYGYSHDNETGHAGEQCMAIPEFLLELKEDFTEMCGKPQGYFNQCIITEIMPHHDIIEHRESPDYGNAVCHLVLGSGTTMRFEEMDGEHEEYHYWPANTLAILMDEARWGWIHGAIAAHYDIVNGVEIPRERRIMLTFRHVMVNPMN